MNLRAVRRFFPKRLNKVSALVLALSAGTVLVIGLASANPVPQLPIFPPSPRVRLSPASLQVNTGDTFSADILVDQAAHVGAYEFTLHYDPSIVHLVDVSVGEFLEGEEDQTFSIEPRIDNKKGQATFASLILGIGKDSSAGARASGKLATVKLRAVGEGKTTLDLDRTHFVDTSLREAVPSSIAGGIVVVERPGIQKGTVVPPPTPYAPTPTPPAGEPINEPPQDPREVQLTTEGFAFLPVWSPDGNRIAFQKSTGIRHPQTKDIVHEVWVMNSDGSDQRRIADNGRYPGFSANSQRLLFTVSVDKRVSEIWDVELDTENRRKVVDSDGDARPAAWLPNGDIAFTQGGRLRIVDTANRERIISNDVELKGSAPFNSYKFSPDGSRIAYHQDRVLQVMSADGDPLATLTTDLDPSLTSYAWSPDSQKLVFITGHGGPLPKLWVTNADSSELQQIVAGNGEHFGSPAWSPDGTTIAFTRRMTGAETAPTAEIYFVHPDGSGLQRVTNNNVNESTLAWSPDGSKIAFVRLEVGTIDPLSQTIWVISVR